MLLLFLVSQLCLYLGNSQVSVYRTIGPLVYIKVGCKGVYITQTCLHDDIGFQTYKMTHQIKFHMPTQKINIVHK